MSQIATASGSQYSDNDRREAMSHYVLLGNAKKVAALTNIPQRTINDWKSSEWGQAMLATIRLEKSDEIDASITAILDASTEQLLDRIEYGDEVCLADDGTPLRLAMKGRDLATVFGITFDKRQIIRNLPTSIKAESTDSRLNSLADKVRELQAGGNNVINQEPDSKE